MAVDPVCSIPDCRNPYFVAGFCRSHYYRNNKYGDPLAGGTAFGEPTRFYQEVVLPYDGDECLAWPYAVTSSGYGILTIRNKNVRVTRMLCTEMFGPPPTASHEAAHSCGNGHMGCVTKKHLRWATPKENGQDKVEHGTSNRGETHGISKLTRDQVLEIRALRGSMAQTKIAQAFGVSQSAVYKIQTGKMWGWLNVGVHNASETG